MENITIENETKNDILDKMVSCTLEEKVVDAAFKEETSIVPKKESVNIVVKEEISARLAKMYSRIIRELHDFFSDRNVECDEYLQTLLQNDDGWVSISLLSTFSTIKCISEEPGIIAAAVKNDTDSILEVDETNEKIRRKPDSRAPIIVNEFINEMIKKTVYCKGFPRSATVDDVLKFAAGFGPENLSYVIPQKDFITGAFNGSIHINFKSEELAENFLKLIPVKYNGIELERMREICFFEEKSKEFFEISQKQKAETEISFEKGYLIKADILSKTITLKLIKIVCNGFNWQVAFIEFFENLKIAWIRLKPVRTAKDLLKEISYKNNDLKIVFSIPEEEIEQFVLKEMCKNMMSKRNLKNQQRQKKKLNFRKRCLRIVKHNE